MNKFITLSKLDEGNLKAFIEHDCKFLKHEIVASKVKISNSREIGNKLLKRFINSVGKPFVPGSSIKGAIRTAIFYSYLKQNCRSIISEIQGILNSKDLSLEKEVNKTKKELDEWFDEIEKEMKIDSICRSIKVRDSSFFQDDMEIISHARTGGKKQEQKLPLLEIVKKGRNFQMELLLESLSDIPEISLEGLFEVLNVFAKDSLEHDEQHFSFLGIKSNNPVYTSLSPSEVLVRLGGMKTYFDNSIGLILKDEDPFLVDKFRKVYDLEPHLKPFPRTKTLTSSGEPLGWVKLKIL
jgi:CRISPR-associated protein Csm5